MSTIVTIGAIGAAVAIGTIVLPVYHLFPKVVIGANVSTVAIGIIFAIGTIVAIKTIFAIGNSVLSAYFHRFLYIVISANVTTVAIGIIFHHCRHWCYCRHWHHCLSSVSSSFPLDRHCFIGANDAAVAIGSIFTIFAIGVIVATETIVTIGVIVANGDHCLTGVSS